MGYAHTIEKLAEVFRFAWNSYRGDPFFIVVARAQHDGGHFVANYTALGPGDEKVLTEFYPTVMGPYWDAQWLTVASTRLSQHEVIDALRMAAAESGTTVDVALDEQIRAKPFVRRWLEIFAAITGLLWIMALPLAALRWGVSGGVFFATAGALTTGISAIPILILLDAVARRGLEPESANPRQRRILLTNRPAAETFGIIERLLSGQSWIRLGAKDPREGYLVARARASLASAGERLVVKVSRVESGETRVSMTSRPVLPPYDVGFRQKLAESRAPPEADARAAPIPDTMTGRRIITGYVSRD